MTRIVPTVLGFLLLATFIATAGFGADLTIVSTVTFNGKSNTATQYVSEEKIRYADGQSDVIVDHTTGQMIFIDHKKKKYSETSIDEMRAKMAEFDEMLEGNAIMERMMGPGGAAEVEKVGGSRDIAGYPCTLYKVTLGPKFVFDLWVTGQLELPTTYYDAAKSRYAAMGPIGARFDKLYDEMKKINGVPLATTTHVGVMGMKFDSEQTATTVTVGSLPADAFALPPYKKAKKSPFE